MRIRPNALTLSVSLLVASNVALAQNSVTCKIQIFKAPAGSSLAPLTNALGVNRYGNVVGEANNGAYIRAANGRISRLPVHVSGFPMVIPYKRNASGITVGTVGNSSGTQWRAFVNAGNKTTVFSAPGLQPMSINGINRFGTLVGNRSDGIETVNNGFVYRNGKVTNLPITWAHRVTAISDTGVIVGDYVKSLDPQPFDDVHGFVLANGKFQDFSAPWAGTTFVTDINASGMIVGVTEGPGGSFIYRNGKFYEPTFMLPDGSTVSGSIFGVNGFGEITGNATGGPFVGKCS